jgi:ankyrin repeat protein
LQIVNVPTELQTSWGSFCCPSYPIRPAKFGRIHIGQLGEHFAHVKSVLETVQLRDCVDRVIGMDDWLGVAYLHKAAWTGNLEAARLLLAFGAELDAIDEEHHSTPLGFAARWGHREMVALLLERGADPNRSGAPWSTPLGWAQRKGHSAIAADLRLAGAH